MSFDDSFLDMMTTALVHLPYRSHDGYGTPSFGPPTVTRCHVTYSTREVRGTTDENTTSTAQVQLPPPGYIISGYDEGNGLVPIIGVDDHIVLPDNVERRVLVVLTRSDQDEIHHTSLMLT